MADYMRQRSLHDADNWIANACSMIKQMSTSDEFAMFHAEEVVHYVTQEQINAGVIDLQPDMRFIHQGFVMPERTEFANPETTFGQKSTVARCARCSGLLVTENIQKRASDEPGNTYHVCDRCGHRQKIG